MYSKLYLLKFRSLLMSPGSRNPVQLRDKMQGVTEVHKRGRYALRWDLAAGTDTFPAFV